MPCAVWAAGFVVGGLAALALVSALGYSGVDRGDLPVWVLLCQQIPYWAVLVAGCWFVSQRAGTGSMVRDYGLRFSAFDLLGFPVGILVQLVFVPVVYFPLRPFIDVDELSRPAQEITDGVQGFEVVLLVLLLVVGAPLVEELFYRGLLQRSLTAAWNDSLALVVTAVLFGVVHFQVLQLPALVLFELVAGYMAMRTGRLGMSVLAHSGFNATTVFLLLR
jgi:membrane protease YdiL (CAAX protease family)